LKPQPSHRVVLGLLLIILLSVIGKLCAQNSTYRFKRFDTRNGLTFNHSRGFIQDSLGYIWIKHLEGISRFDGNSFKQFKYVKDDSLRTELNTLIGDLIKGTSGKIYVRSNNDLLEYDHKTDGFKKIKLGLENVVLQDFLFDPDGRHLWISTFLKGIFRIDIETGESINYFNQHSDEETELLQNDINCIADLGDDLLLATVKGLWLFEKSSGNFKRPPCPPKDTAIIYNRAFGSFKSQHRKSIWLGYWYGSKIDLKTKYHTPVPSPDGDHGGFVKIGDNFSIVKQFFLPDEIVGFSSVDVSDSDVFWFGVGGKGIFRFDPQTKNLLHLEHDPSDPESINSNRVFDVSLDREGNLWVATNKGINLLKRRSVNFQNIEFSGGMVDALELYEANDREYVVLGKRTDAFLHVDNPNDLWISPISKEVPTLDFQKSVAPLKAYAITYTSRGNKHLWVSAVGNGVFGFLIDPLSGKVNPHPDKTYKVIPGNKNSIGHRQVTSILEDVDGDLWIGNKNTGLDWISGTHRYGEDGSVINFQHSESDTASLQNNNIVYLYPEGDSELWVVTEGGVDLLHWDKGKRSGWFEHVFSDNEVPNIIYRTRDSIRLLGTVNGLYEIKRNHNRFYVDADPLWSESGITAIQEDKLGRWWLYGTTSLVFYDPKKRTTVEFNETDGLVHMHAFDVDRMRLTREGLMILADSEGVSLFDPSKFIPDSTPVYPILTLLKINNKSLVGQSIPGYENFMITNDISFLHELTLDHLHNNFSIEFSAMQMADPEKNLYRYKLEGYDQEWIETDYKNRTATYTNLPAGTYTFRVKASNHHGVWSDNERTLKVIILPPPWRTWWAYTGYGVMVVGLLVWARNNIVQRERLKSNLALEKVEREKEHFELEKAKEVDKVKTSFFTNISHEFRTPLTLIKGPVETLLDKFKDDPEAVSRLKLVQRNSDLLLRLINQLLDLAKLESGSLKVEKTEGDLFSFVRAVASSFESFARQKNVSLLVNVPEGSCHALFDKDKVETILINLINNAIKFTPAGGSVRASIDLTPLPPLRRRGGDSPEFIVGAKLKSVPSNGAVNLQSEHTPLLWRGAGGEVAWVNLTVSDTGIGIPADHQQKIFERFHQVSEAHKEVGTGIGLSLVKELVGLMGGTIEVKSEVGKGSEFVVKLPIEIVASPQLPVISKQIPNSDYSPPVTGDLPTGQAGRQPATIIELNEDGESTKPHVLIVEDNTDLRHFIIDSLGNEFHFLEAENGVQGLEKATNEVPDLIISDVMMPEMDGITMAGKIKKDIRTSHIPLILLTAKSSEDNKLSGLQSGADDYLTKPFNRNELLLKVRNGVNRQLKLREKLRAELMSTAPKVEVLSEDEKFLNSVKEKILERLSDEQLSVESLAEDIGMSRVQLYRKVSGLTGISVNELIRKLRLQKAAQLLEQKWGPVSQVAYEVGFSNLSYFSKVFKEEFGVLPSEYA
jgi:signal transduction histidine kinase/DNA-binding response OmpR family regulator/ligand-binding sensor domain-containing protein